MRVDAIKPVQNTQSAKPRTRESVDPRSTLVESFIRLFNGAGPDIRTSISRILDEIGKLDPKLRTDIEALVKEYNNAIDDLDPSDDTFDKTVAKIRALI